MREGGQRHRFVGSRVTSTISIALVLFVLGLLLAGGVLVRRMADVLRERFTVTLTVAPEAPAGYGARLAERLRGEPYAAEVTYISADSALAIVARELGEDPMEFLDFNPVRPVVELRLRAAYAESDSIEAVSARLLEGEGSRLERVDYSRAEVDLVNASLRRYGLLLGGLGLLLLVVSVSLIGLAVRLSLYADRFLIYTMRLVGATDWFIRWPFVRRHALCGLVAAGLAVVALAGLTVALDDPRLAAEAQARPWEVAALCAILAAAGLLIPGLAAMHACSKYLSHTEDELYLM